MNYYVNVINRTVDYIEQSIDKNLQLSDLSMVAGISDFHFSRIFKTVTGNSLKQYILGRKLTKAAEQLQTTDLSVLDIALNFGFEYPEVFSRAFKNQFGVSPLQYRKNLTRVKQTPKVAVVERDIINYRGTLALKGSYVKLSEAVLYGVLTRIDTNDDSYEGQLREKNNRFLSDTASDNRFCADQFFTVVACSGKENGDYTVFCGRRADENIAEFEPFRVPEGWYADFLYTGDMFDIKEVFIDDLYKWIMVKEAELNPNGIGMLNIYESDYTNNENNQIHILVPIKKPI